MMRKAQAKTAPKHAHTREKQLHRLKETRDSKRNFGTKEMSGCS